MADLRSNTNSRYPLKTIDNLVKDYYNNHELFCGGLVSRAFKNALWSIRPLTIKQKRKEEYSKV